MCRISCFFVDVIYRINQFFFNNRIIKFLSHFVCVGLLQMECDGSRFTGIAF